MSPKNLFALSLGIAAAMLVAQTVRASQFECASRAAIVARLTEDFGETRQAVALTDDQRLIETYVSAQTGTWSIVASQPNGFACLIASGEFWQAENNDPKA
ncbi:MAG TPA: hypothetical protein VLA51_09920 [Paracoccaceae bacterium]|nr:hypothetical protein [Paracoccaceae bacterium]